MALDSRVQSHNNTNTSFYTFGSSSSAHHHLPDLCDGDLSSASQLGFHRLTKSSSSYLKQRHMMQGGGGGGGGPGKVLSDSNDGSLISFEDSTEAAAGGHGYEQSSASARHSVDCFNNSHQTASSSLDSHLMAGDDRNHLKGKVHNRSDEMLDWFYSADVSDDQIAVSEQHPSMNENYMHPNKKQCTATTTTKKSKPKPVVTSKDPQSIAAKNRRERISERLKILQELVPNGTKVDLVTMLEKAISYVKFLQLQVKVLAADEFWPVQGGKAPELSQVKDAIDAILSSQRSDRNSASD